MTKNEVSRELNFSDEDDIPKVYVTSSNEEDEVPNSSPLSNIEESEKKISKIVRSYYKVVRFLR